MLSAFARACTACALLFVIPSVNAQSPGESVNPEGELTLARGIDAALRSNPDLLASAYELSAAQARIVQAGLRPNPGLGLELENFAGTGATKRIDSLETTLSLSQVVELGGKRGLRRAAAEADLDVVGVEQRARELDVLSEVTGRFIDVVAAQERVRFAIQATALAQKTLDAIGARVEAGRSPEAERSRARIALTRALLEQRQAESELRAARYALSATWGSPEPAFTSARAELFDLRAVESFQALMDKLEQSPDFTRFASESRLREAELRLARVQARPNLTFSVGVRRFEVNSDTALVAGFSMPLPVYDRNQGTIREAQVRLNQTDALRNAARVRARASLLALYQEMNTDRARVDTLRNEAMPQAQLALDQTRSGYDRGRFSFLELITVQEELLALQAAAIDAAADYHRVLAEIERLTSAALTRPISTP
ncbi:MAG: TolC family protein [Steroidobacter sp.]|nr:TolC family protein [Steroidobacter sp.]